MNNGTDRATKPSILTVPGQLSDSDLVLLTLNSWCFRNRSNIAGKHLLGDFVKNKILVVIIAHLRKSQTNGKLRSACQENS